ncbi:hypothetical protein FB45DRAFT_873873 [Roridomyces roridus]|uniref:Uncharacterized protein n=1 Tax=Roridomyces roridus TaxID=1738132 RepID=A0AAD7FBM4_9AGAR|nr:hypothetical protein FB45DRAFT_873873 [Roridomyces roridus]
MDLSNCGGAFAVRGSFGLGSSLREEDHGVQEVGRQGGGFLAHKPNHCLNEASLVQPCQTDSLETDSYGSATVFLMRDEHRPSTGNGRQSYGLRRLRAVKKTAVLFTFQWVRRDGTAKLTVLSRDVANIWSQMSHQSANKRLIVPSDPKHIVNTCLRRLSDHRLNRVRSKIPLIRPSRMPTRRRPVNLLSINCQEFFQDSESTNSESTGQIYGETRSTACIELFLPNSLSLECAGHLRECPYAPASALAPSRNSSLVSETLEIPGCLPISGYMDMRIWGGILLLIFGARLEHVYSYVSVHQSLTADVACTPNSTADRTRSSGTLSQKSFLLLSGVGACGSVRKPNSHNPDPCYCDDHPSFGLGHVPALVDPASNVGRQLLEQEQANLHEPYDLFYHGGGQSRFVPFSSEIGGRRMYMFGLWRRMFGRMSSLETRSVYVHRVMT